MLDAAPNGDQKYRVNGRHADAVLNSLQVPGGTSVAIFGTGAVGIAALMAARIVGANPIFDVDIVNIRLNLAQELDATQTINSRQENIASCC